MYKRDSIFPEFTFLKIPTNAKATDDNEGVLFVKKVSISKENRI
jgi:hypothetical protein